MPITSIFFQNALRVSKSFFVITAWLAYFFFGSFVVVWIEFQVQAGIYSLLDLPPPQKHVESAAIEKAKKCDHECAPCKNSLE